MANPSSSSDLVRSRLMAGSLPLVIYPFCFMGAMMSFAGHESAPPPLAVKIVVFGFLWSSLLYPLVYILSLLFALFLQSQGFMIPAERIAYIPLRYLVGVVLLFLAWLALEFTGAIP